MSIKDFNFKGAFIGFCIIKDKAKNIVIVKTCDGTRKQADDKIYDYRKTLDDKNIITLEIATIKNFGTISKDYIQTRINRFTEQTKSDKYIIE